MPLSLGRPALEPSGSSNVMPILSSVGMVVIAVTPAYLTGALAVQIRGELGFGPAALGVAVSWFFLTSSLASAPMGQAVERLGVRRSLAMGAVGTSLGLVGLGTTMSFTWMLLAMALCGLSNATTQPAVNVVLSTRISSSRLGLAFGIKQAGIPMATLIAGLAIPTASVLVGWRGTFLLAAGAALTGGITAWYRGARGAGAVGHTKRRIRDVPEVGPLILLSAGGLLGGAAATSLGVFMVDAAVDGGIREASAGLMFAMVSAGGLLSRILMGWYADGHPARSRYGTIAFLLLIAVPGYLMLTLGTPLVYLLGASLAYIAGWAWPGLFHFAVVSQNPLTPAAATGLIQTGLSLGAGLGPMAFGYVAETRGYASAWVLAAVLSAASGVVILFGREYLRRHRRQASASHLDEVLALVWEDGDPTIVASGVQLQRRSTEHLRVTIYQVTPGANYEPGPARRTGVVFVVAGSEAQLNISGVDTVVAPRDHLPLPANRTWRLSNRGVTTSLIAQVEHEGNHYTTG